MLQDRIHGVGMSLIPSQSASDNPTTIAGYGLAIARALEYKGVDSRRVFRAAGLSETFTNDPLQRIPISGISQLYKVCREVTLDPYFGLTVGRFIHASNIHAVGYALMASSTLMDFCERLARYFRLLTRRAEMELVRDRWEVRLKFNYIAESCDDSEDAWLSFLIRSMRLLYRTDLKPLRVELARGRPQEGEAPYLELFGAPVTFGNAEAVLAFDRSDLDRPLQGACPELAQFNDNIAAGYVAKLDRSDIVASTRAKLIDLLPSGRCSLAETARAVGLAPSTLKLKLAQRGTNFQALLDEMRADFARSYLSQPNLSITEITFLLGFTDVSNFTRAFRRWTGLSPSAYRSGA
ncbi:AraC family transcriptional regulator [Bradyrhizobium erythrophlei]|uniref:AraC family transcriptional regulator n=1 Tax=Bradyrhizobium erythrophlei TaxID=1437360 RepID=UPI0035E80397